MRRRGRIACESEIRFAFFDETQYVFGIRHSNADIHMRIRFSISSKSRRQQVASRDRTGGERQFTVQFRLQVANCLPRLNTKINDPSRIFVELAAGPGQCDASRVSVKKPNSQVSFKSIHSLT